MPYRDWLPRAAPPWLQKGWGRKVLEEVGGAIDDQRDRLNQAVKARFPAYAPADALPQIGKDRTLLRGPTDTDATYGERLRTAWTTWELAGGHKGLLTQLYASGFTTANIIQKNGRYTSIDGAGTVTFTDFVGPFVFDYRDASYYNQFAILFPADVPSVVAGSADAATIHKLARAWKPGKAMYMGIFVITGTPVWGWPTTRTWGTDNWASGGSRYIPAP